MSGSVELTPAFLAALARAAGFVQTAPLLSEPAVGHVPRLCIALVLTLALAPVWGSREPGAQEPIGLCATLIVELLLGALLGLAASIPVRAAAAAIEAFPSLGGQGLDLGSATGLGGAIAVAAFLAAGGDHMILRFLCVSLTAGTSAGRMASAAHGLGPAWFGQMAALALPLGLLALATQALAAWVVRPRPLAATLIEPATPLIALACLTLVLPAWPALLAAWADPMILAGGR